jgi:hypothetical protein
VTSPAVWPSLSLAARATPLVVTVVVAARQQAVEASRQAAVRQVAAVVPRWMVEEAALLAVLVPLCPPQGQIGTCHSR